MINDQQVAWPRHTGEGVNHCYETAIRPSVCLSLPCFYSSTTVYFCGYGYYRTLIRNRTLKVELSGQRGRTTTGSVSVSVCFCSTMHSSFAMSRSVHIILMISLHLHWPHFITSENSEACDWSQPWRTGSFHGAPSGSKPWLQVCKRWRALSSDEMRSDEMTWVIRTPV